MIYLLGTGWLAAPGSANADWNATASGSVRHDSNVGNAQDSYDSFSDSSLAAQLSVARPIFLGDGLSMTLAGNLDGEVFRHLTGLNNGTLSTEIALKKKWGLGALAPWSILGLSVGRSSYDDSYRNAWIYRATLAAGRRNDERWNLWGEYRFERRAAKPEAAEDDDFLSTDAFSQTSHTLEFNLQYSATERTYLGATLLARHGDVTSTTEAGLKIFNAARALADDPAFGDEAYAYRLIGTTLGARVGVNFEVTRHSLLGCGFERLDTRAEGGNNYTKSVVDLTWEYHF